MNPAALQDAPASRVEICVVRRVCQLFPFDFRASAHLGPKTLDGKKQGFRHIVVYKRAPKLIDEEMLDQKKFESSALRP